MRGFAIGSFGLIVAYVILQPGSTDRLVAGNNFLMNTFRRALSGEVPAIPKKKKKETTGHLFDQFKDKPSTSASQGNTYTV